MILKETAWLLIEKVRDPRVGGVTLTGIELSPDLKTARIYFSIIGEGSRKAEALSGLESARGFIKREIGARLDLRYVPEISFHHDETLERAGRIENLFASLKKDAPVGES